VGETGGYYDALETREPEAREREQMAALSRQIAHAKAKTAYFGALLKDVDAAELTSREALARLPVTRKGDLAKAQKANPPFGGLVAEERAKLRHVFMSPGPLYEPDGEHKDYWRFGRALWAAGARPGDLVHNTFSYHLVPAGILAETGAAAIGCPVFPAGVGNTEIQVQAIADLRPAIYAGTPSFLRILSEKADELKLDFTSIKKGMVGAEALTPSLRQAMQARGIELFNTYGTADVGLIGYESVAHEGMLIDESIVFELIEPLGSRPVAEGEIGEVTVTVLTPTYPLIRYGTGDLSAALPGRSPCGRTNARIKGWMGRADQSTKVRGMFVHAANVMEVARRHPEIKKARLVVTSKENRDEMTLKCVVEGGGEGLREAIAASVQSVLKLRGVVEVVASLPDDGKVVEDARTYE
jgi:phenylacetate-CoA ligase